MLVQKTEKRLFTKKSNLRRSFGWQDRILDGIIVVVLMIVAISTLYPLYFVLIASFSNPVHIGNGEVILWPRGANLLAYETLIADGRIWIGYRNSLFYTTVGTFLNLCVTVPCAYALSRRNLPGQKIFFFFFMFTMYFSGGMIPTYVLMSQLKLLNTIWIMIIPNGIGVFNLLIARSFFRENIPEELFDSARIDGASITRFFFYFVIPLSKAIIAVLTLFYALGHWNAYFYPMLYLQDSSKLPLQVVIRGITANLDANVIEGYNPSQISEMVLRQQLLKYAIVVVSVVPMMLLYPFIQKYFVSGIMIGAVKG